jgi:acyl-CoA synthetase (AMP-forming)/AMP-acid ligase II
MMRSTSRLETLLVDVAQGEAGLTFYTPEDAEPEFLSYHGLHKEALFKAGCLQMLDNLIQSRIVLIHFRSHRDNIVWFWASILAGYVPAMSTPFIKSHEGRRAHLSHLHRLLLDPLVITSRELLSNDFSENTLLRCVAVEDFDAIRSDESEILGKSENTDGTDNRFSLSNREDTNKSHATVIAKPITESPTSISNQIQDALVSDLDGQAGTWSENSSSDEGAGVSEHGYETRASSAGSWSARGHTSGDNKNEVKQHNAPENVFSDNAVVDFTSLESVAALMLTSGSTGAAKAVCLKHEQLLTACSSKLSHMPMSPGATVLNWIGLDHVGSLTELHLTAMVAGCNQVHISTSEIIADPLALLRLLSKHRVSRTFAPNFMMAKLLQLLDSTPDSDVQDVNLRDLLYLISGGEPNSVEVCARLSAHFVKLGARTKYTIKPGFGMTETCAGSIYNKKCPEIDLQTGTEFTALGTCVPGIEMRIHDGELEISGPIVFQHYFNNAEASRAAFTDDGWFRTGDTATIDAAGILRLVGRSKDLVIINGVKYLSHELETAINQAKIPGVALSHVVCFAYRPVHADTEQIQVVYQRDYEVNDVERRMDALRAIIKTVLFFAGARPRVLPLAPGRLERSTLGKLSRKKVMEALLIGDYQEELECDEHYSLLYETEHVGDKGDYMKQKLMGVFRNCQLGAPGMGIDTPILDTGVNSVDLIRFKRAAEKAFDIVEIPMVTIMTNTTIRTLAAAIKQIQGPSEGISYQPIITLQPNGDKTPLFLLHPGIGEMLVFLGLVQYFPDRPIYAMRARGLNEGETPFTSQEQVVITYHRAMKEK